MSRALSTSPPPDAAAPLRSPEAPAPGTDLGEHYAHCFACGHRPPSGLRMRLVAGEGTTVTAWFTVGRAHQGAPGLAHGGVLAAALDEAFGAVGVTLRQPMVTARLETEFRMPVPVGSTLRIEAAAHARAGRRVWMSGAGYLGDGLAVLAEAVFVAVPPRHFERYGRPEDVAASAADPALSGNRHYAL